MIFSMKWHVENGMIQQVFEEKIAQTLPASEEEPKWRLILSITPMESLAVKLEKPDTETSDQGVMSLTFFISTPLQENLFSKSKLIFDSTKAESYAYADFMSRKEFNDLRLNEFEMNCKCVKVEQNLEIYNKLGNDIKYTDIKIIIGDKSYLAHQQILAVNSSLLRRMLSQEKVSETKTMNLDQIHLDPDTFSRLLNYMYTRKISSDDEENPSIESIVDVFLGALKLGIYDLKNECLAILEKTENREDIINILMKCFNDPYYGKHGYDDLRDVTNLGRKIIVENLEQFSQSDSFRHLLEIHPIFTIAVMNDIFKLLNNSECKGKKERAIDSDDKKINEDFGAFLNKEILSDAEIQCERNKYWGHRVIMARKSDFFRRKFLTEKKKTVNINDIEPDVFFKCLKYLYTNELENVDCGKARMIFDAANKLGIVELEHECERILNGTLTINNIFETIMFAEERRLEKLKKSCLHSIIDRDFFRDTNFLGKLWDDHPKLIFELLKQIILDYEFTDENVKPVNEETSMEIENGVQNRNACTCTPLPSTSGTIMENGGVEKCQSCESSDPMNKVVKKRRKRKHLKNTGRYRDWGNKPRRRIRSSSVAKVNIANLSEI